MWPAQPAAWRVGGPCLERLFHTPGKTSPSAPSARCEMGAWQTGRGGRSRVLPLRRGGKVAAGLGPCPLAGWGLGPAPGSRAGWERLGSTWWGWQTEHRAASQVTSVSRTLQASCVSAAVDSSPLQASVSRAVPLLASVAWDALSGWRGCVGPPGAGGQRKSPGTGPARARRSGHPSRLEFHS